MEIEAIFKRNPSGVRELLKNKTAGIAGCGGLGSNIAVSLVRTGLGSLIIADFDVVEPSNLNRQFYFLDDIGKYKVEAIQKYLTGINPHTRITAVKEKLTPDNLGRYFKNVDVMIEAFDLAEKKKWLIDRWCSQFSHIPLVCASGVSGYGRFDDLKLVRAGNLYVCGDQSSDSVADGLCATRVAIAANMQANTAVEILMKKEEQ